MVHEKKNSPCAYETPKPSAGDSKTAVDDSEAAEEEKIEETPLSGNQFPKGPKKEFRPHIGYRQQFHGLLGIILKDLFGNGIFDCSLGAEKAQGGMPCGTAHCAGNDFVTQVLPAGYGYFRDMSGGGFCAAISPSRFYQIWKAFIERHEPRPAGFEGWIGPKQAKTKVLFASSLDVRSFFHRGRP